MVIEQVLSYNLHLAIVESNLPAVWENMIIHKIIPKGSIAPDYADEVLKTLYENIDKKNHGDTTLLLSHVLDVAPLQPDSEAAQELLQYKMSITSGDLILTNTVRNCEEQFRLVSKQEQNILGFLALMGIGFTIFLGYKMIKKLLK